MDVLVGKLLVPSPRMLPSDWLPVTPRLASISIGVEIVEDGVKRRDLLVRRWIFITGGPESLDNVAEGGGEKNEDVAALLGEGVASDSIEAQDLMRVKLFPEGWK
jgi:hypothetical protein